MSESTYSSLWETATAAMNETKGTPTKKTKAHDYRRKNKHYKHTYLYNNSADHRQLNIMDFLKYKQDMGKDVKYKAEGANQNKFRISVPDNGTGHRMHSVVVSVVPLKENPKHSGSIFVRWQDKDRYKHEYSRNGISTLGNFMLMYHNHFHASDPINPQLDPERAQEWARKHRAKFVDDYHKHYGTYRTHFTSKGTIYADGGYRSKSSHAKNKTWQDKRRFYKDPQGTMAYRYLCDRRGMSPKLVKRFLDSGLIRSYNGRLTWDKIKTNNPAKIAELKDHGQRKAKEDALDAVNKDPEINKRSKADTTINRFTRLYNQRQSSGQPLPKLSDYLHGDLYQKFQKVAKRDIAQSKHNLEKRGIDFQSQRKSPLGNYTVADQYRGMFLTHACMSFQDSLHNKAENIRHDKMGRALPKFQKRDVGNYNRKTHTFYQPGKYYKPMIEFVWRLPDNKTQAQSNYYQPKREKVVGVDRIFLTDSAKADKTMFQRGKEVPSGSADDKAGFNFKTGSGRDNLYIFEDSIDAISFYHFHHEQAMANSTFLSLDGVSKVGKINKFIKAQYPKKGDFKNIILCPDNDDAGHEMVEKFMAPQHDKSKYTYSINPVTHSKQHVSVNVPGVDRFPVGRSYTYRQTVPAFNKNFVGHWKDYNDVLQSVNTKKGLTRMGSKRLARYTLKRPDASMNINEYSRYLVDSATRRLNDPRARNPLNNAKHFSRFLSAYSGLCKQAPNLFDKRTNHYSVRPNNEFVKRMRYDFKRITPKGRTAALDFMNHGGGQYLSGQDLAKYSQHRENKEKELGLDYRGLSHTSKYMARSVKKSVNQMMSKMHTNVSKQGLAYTLRSYVPILKAHEYGAPTKGRDKKAYNLGMALNKGSLSKIKGQSITDFLWTKKCLFDTVPAFENAPGSNFDYVGQYATNYLKSHQIPASHFQDFMPQQKNHTANAVHHAPHQPEWITYLKKRNIKHAKHAKDIRAKSKPKHEMTSDKSIPKEFRGIPEEVERGKRINAKRVKIRQIKHKQAIAKLRRMGQVRPNTPTYQRSRNGHERD